MADPVSSGEGGRITRFLLVGGVGFLVDLTAFAVLIEIVHLNPYGARPVAFLVAVGCTWLLNRNLTFRRVVTRSWRQELGRYLVSSSLAGLANIATYSVVILAAGSQFPARYIALAAGVMAGLVLNYNLYSRFVFTRTPGRA